jgi:hypothetical protein
MRRTLAVALLLCAVFACAAAAAAPRTSKAPWPRPNDTLSLTAIAGLKPETHEFFDYHVHAHLDIFVNARRVRVPGGIGIDITNPAVKRLRLPNGTFAFGGISPPCKSPCISPLHTHSSDGILHTESQNHRPNELGQFFTEWRVRLTGKCVGGYCTEVRFYVNGKRYRRDPRTIQLTDHKEIAIVIGKPPAVIPSAFPTG